jgi:hypothetical protein
METIPNTTKIINSTSQSNDIQLIGDENSVLPIIPAIKQLLFVDILGNVQNISSSVQDYFSDDIETISNMIGLNQFSDNVSNIMDFLPMIMDFLPEQKISEIAVAILIDEKLTSDVSQLLAQNLAKGANIFIEEFNNSTKEKQEELKQMVKQLVDDAVSSAGSGLTTGLTNAVSDIPPVGAIMGVVSLLRGLIDSADRVIRKAEIAEDTASEIINKTLHRFDKEINNSGIIELYQTADALRQIQQASQGIQPEQLGNIISQATNKALLNTQPIKQSPIEPTIQQTGGKKSILKTRKNHNKKYKLKNKTKKVRFKI